MLSYLPMMFDVSGKKLLIVGGGAIAHEKLSRICDLDCDISVVAVEFSHDMLRLMEQKNIPYTIREYRSIDLEDISIVIAATDDQELQKRIFSEASAKKILCNSVDLAESCHFIFPSVIRRGDFILSVSTSGASPAFAKYFKKYLENILPNDIEDFLKNMKETRTRLPKGKERMALLDEMARKYFDPL